MTELNPSVSLDPGPEVLPTPALPDINQPVSPGIGPEGLPTPSLPSQPSQPSQPYCYEQSNTNCRCPAGYTRRTVQGGQNFTDLLLENNVSYDAMRIANPALPTGRPATGTPYCAPPSGSRRVCAYGSSSYVMGAGETLYSLTLTQNTTTARLLRANPELAPSDFLPGRVVCLP